MRLADRPGMERLLESLGAKPVAKLTETNTFFDTAEGLLKSSDQGLRVRVEIDEQGNRRSIITHKGPRAHGQLKSRSETEVEVADPRRAAELLDALGYHQGVSFEKRRTRWSLEGCNVELDTLPFLGDFIEIEGPSDERVLAVRDKLGLSDAALMRSSYIAMLWSYMREHNLHTTHIAFSEAETKANAAAPASA